MSLLGYSSAAQYIVTGVILLAAVTLDTVSRRQTRPGGRAQRFGDRREAEGAASASSADRRRHARLRLHGQGPLDAFRSSLHELAAAARCRGSSRSAGATGTPPRRSPRATAGARTTDWREQVADPASSSSTTAARTRCTPSRRSPRREAGKHVLCEKPLGARRGRERTTMWRARRRPGVVHLCGFNYRFVPAIRRARDLVERGRARRDSCTSAARYLQSWGWDAPTDVWRFDRAQAGTGAIGDLGAHIVDLARFLAGEIASVSALVRTFVPGREVDDAFAATVEFESGAVGTLEASRLALGRRNETLLRSTARKGSIAFDLERSTSCWSRADGGPYRLQERARLGGRPPLGLVAARPHPRLGRHVRARDPPPAARDRGRQRRRRRTAPRSRTATAPPRSATRSCARPSGAGDQREDRTANDRA